MDHVCIGIEMSAHIGFEEIVVPVVDELFALLLVDMSILPKDDVKVMFKDVGTVDIVVIKNRGTSSIGHS